MNEEINNGAVRVLREYTGRGPTKARSVIDRDSVTILLADTLTVGERRLAEGGKADHVLETRHEFQRLMRDDLREGGRGRPRPHGDRFHERQPHRSRHGCRNFRAGAG